MEASIASLMFQGKTEEYKQTPTTAEILNTYTYTGTAKAVTATDASPVPTPKYQFEQGGMLVYEVSANVASFCNTIGAGVEFAFGNRLGIRLQPDNTASEMVSNAQE